MDETLITLDDMRGAGFCAPGIYNMLMSNGWTKSQFRHFAEHGVPLSEIQGLGHDALLSRVLEFKKGKTDGR